MKLSKIEKLIIEMISEEVPNKLIASRLNLSQRMIEHHITRIIKKMKVQTRVGIIVKSFRYNIIE